MKQNLTLISKLFMLLFFFSLAACEDDNNTDLEEQEPKNEPTLLKCSFFNEDQILTNNPDAEVDYIIDCAVALRYNTLTIEPGVVIEFTENGSIEVERFDDKAALIAVGTEEEPIIFRGTKPTKGHWKGIIFTNNNKANELKYVTIRDAGKSSWSGYSQGGVSIGYLGSGAIKISNSQFINNKEAGLDINFFNREAKINFELKNNVFKENDYPIHASIYTLHAIEPSNDLIGNMKDEILTNSAGNSTLSTVNDGTWHNHGVPYIFKSGALAFDSKITIEPGVELRLPEAGKIVINSDGGLIAVGTEEEPIIFTGVEKLNRYWEGINFNSSYPGNEISHAIIEYCGQQLSNDNTYNVIVSAGNPIRYAKLSNIIFRNINTSKCAIILDANSIWGSSADISNISIDTNGDLSLEESCILYDKNLEF